MRLPRLTRKQKAGLAAAMALLMLIPTGISERSQPLVTGHSTFYNGSGYDPCLASVAGILRTQVLWFNDMVLAERYGGPGTFIWLTEGGGRDPRELSYLYSEGVFYDFVDPNGAHWHVEELFMTGGQLVHQEGDVEEEVDAVPDPAQTVDTDPPGVNDPQQWAPRANASSNVTVDTDDKAKRQYVWTVELAERPIHDEFAGPADGPEYHDLYNFVLLVDTCKMREDHSQAGRDPGDPGDPYNVTHNGTEPGHPIGETSHAHEMHLADIYVGTRPLVVPFAPDEQNDEATWSAEWYSSSQGQQQTSGAAGHRAEDAQEAAP